MHVCVDRTHIIYVQCIICEFIRYKYRDVGLRDVAMMLHCTYLILIGVINTLIEIDWLIVHCNSLFIIFLSVTCCIVHL